MTWKEVVVYDSDRLVQETLLVVRSQKWKAGVGEEGVKGISSSICFYWRICFYGGIQTGQSVTGEPFGAYRRRLISRCFTEMWDRSEILMINW